MNKVVVRCADKRLVKGLVLDFSPTKSVVHIVDPNDRKRVTELPSSELKALFFVKTLAGDRDYSPAAEFSKESLKGIPGLKLKVTFRDGEVIYGTTNGYSAGRPGFFLIPVDKATNNIRVYVYATSTQSVETWT